MDQMLFRLMAVTEAGSIGSDRQWCTMLSLDRGRPTCLPGGTPT